jgi:hypothetical protein
MKQLFKILVILFVFQAGYSQEIPKVKKESADEPTPLIEQKTISKDQIIISTDTKEVLNDNNYKGRETELKVKSPNSFDHQYLKYINSPVENKDYVALNNAYKVALNNKELQFEMAKYYEISNDLVNKKELCKKLNSSLSTSLKEYAYNVLMSVEKDGILITYGKDDTYPIWILQELENVRKDVKILNYDLLINTRYRKEQENKLGLKLARKYNSNIDILRDIATKNPSKKIYYSLTVSHLVLKELKNNLYTTGLALKYSETQYNNTQMLKTNWEEGFKKEGLQSTNKIGVDAKIELNYLLALVQLSKYYKTNNLPKQYEEVKKLALIIAKRNGKESQVTKLFN